MKFLKAINKKILLEILFYFHLTFGFFIATAITVYFKLSHYKMALIWSIIFVILLSLKTINKIKEK